MEHKDLELKDIVKYNNKKYFISTIKMQVRHGWLNQHSNVFVYETMVFNVEDDKIIYHEPVLNKRYNSYENAYEGHKDIIVNIEDVIKRYETELVANNYNK